MAGNETIYPFLPFQVSRISVGDGLGGKGGRRKIGNQCFQGSFFRGGTAVCGGVRFTAFGRQGFTAGT